MDLVASLLGIKCLAVESIIGLKIQAYVNNPRREYQDKADIVALIAKHPALGWRQVLEYADLFGQRDVLRELKDKALAP